MGQAIGDAFGAGIEFSSREWICKNVDMTRYVLNKKGIWAYNQNIGQYTDDCEMVSVRSLRSQFSLSFFSRTQRIRSSISLSPFNRRSG